MSTIISLLRAFFPFSIVIARRAALETLGPILIYRLLVVKGRPRSTSKPTRGLDLGEVRRRTSLLSGRSAAPPPPVSAPTRRTAAAPRPTTASSYLGADWGRQGAPASSTDEVPSHPLHASATASGGGSGGNYFNEEFLRKREQGGCTGTRGVEQGGQGGNNLMDSTGNFFNTARSADRPSLKTAVTRTLHGYLVPLRRFK